jgi:hypothetical protein
LLVRFLPRRGAGDRERRGRGRASSDGAGTPWAELGGSSSSSGGSKQPVHFTYPGVEDGSGLGLIFLGCSLIFLFAFLNSSWQLAILAHKVGERGRQARGEKKKKILWAA